MRCKHNVGWLAIKDAVVFVFEDGKVRFNFTSRDIKTSKIKMRCNNRDCDKIRNVYISAKVEKYGKVVKGDGEG